MSKIGVSFSVDVTKIDKARIINGKKGKYVDMQAFIDLDEQGQYGDNGMVVQAVSKEERQAGVKGPILGNVKVFYRDDQPQQQPPQQNYQNAQANYAQQQAAPGPGAPAGSDFDDEVPFLRMLSIYGG